MYRLSSSQRGVALVIVLGFLALITVVIVAFLSSVSTEYTTATSAAAGASARELADASVQLVMGQIRQATSLGANVAWASQPGMIRTYGSGSAGSYSAASSPLAYYKLYSSDHMVADSPATSGFDPGADVPGNWSLRPALFTDLNAPITSAAGTKNYPIIDPAAALDPSGNAVVSGSTYSMVDGFSINQTSTSPASTTNSPNNKAPMPTKWIYVLRDGTLTAPIDADSSPAGATPAYAEFRNAAAGKVPSTDNPIVGRIAFWTDDETCKLNLNTACGGIYWDDPRFTTDMEMEFSRYKPVANEFNRYPGHPATTSLLPVFWSFLGMSTPYDNLFVNMDASQYSGSIDINPTLPNASGSIWSKLLKFAPRNAWGGSQMGSVATNGSSANATQVALDSDRLYASVDEAIFGDPQRGAASTPNALSMGKDQLKKARFFLTTTSRSPETNPFNQPKVGIWPVPQLPANRTASDRLLAFCSTLNNNPYYFTRNAPYSSTLDWTSRNNQLFDYLDGALQKGAPGFGQSLSSRYGIDGDRRILTLIYDYIRSTINLEDTSFGYTIDASEGNFGNCRVYNQTFAPPNIRLPGYGQITPINITKSGTTYKGAGRFPTIKQAAVLFMARAANQPPGSPLHPVINAAGDSYPTIDAGTTAAVPLVPLAVPRVGRNPAFLPNTIYTPAIVAAKTLADPTFPTQLAVELSTRPWDFQTHAGLPYLTINNLVATSLPAVSYPLPVGTVPNPRYQGGGACPATDHWGNANSRQLPDPAALPLGATEMQALFLIDPVDLANANVPLSPRYQVRVSGLSGFKADGISLGFPDPTTQSSSTRQPTTYYTLGMDTISVGQGNRYGVPRTSAGTANGKLSFISVPVIVNGATFAFTGGTLTLEVYALPDVPSNANFSVPTTPLGTLVQTYQINFPNATFPTPLLPPMPAGFQGAQFANELIISNPNTASSNFSSYSISNTPTIAADLVSSNMLTPDLDNLLSKGTVAGAVVTGGPNYGVGPLLINGVNSAYMDGVIDLAAWHPYPARRCRFYYETGNSNDGCLTAYFLPERNGDPSVDQAVKRTCDTIRSVECLYGDPRVYASKPVVGTEFFAPHRLYNDTTMRAAHTLRGAIGCNYPGSVYTNPSLYRGATEHCLSDAYVSNSNWNYNSYLTTWPPSVFYRKQGTLLDRLAGANSSVCMQNGIASSSPFVSSSTEFDDSVFSSPSPGFLNPWLGLTRFSQVWANGGDFSNGIGSEPDGPFINKPNEAGGIDTGGSGANTNLYPEWWLYAAGGHTGITPVILPAQFSPNRMISSPVAFGSLPAGNTPTDAWRTLLFCPNPNASSPVSYATRMSGTDVTTPGSVPSGSKCPDHLLLDFFTMPVVEPYAISEPFSTAGKVNMNYQIAPFTYINRNTALRGVLAGTMVTAVDDKWVSSMASPSTNLGSHYKDAGATPYGGGPAYANYNALTGTRTADTYGTFLQSSGHWGFRYPIHAAETLKQFQARFDNGDLFRSPSEICSLFLYPATQPTTNTPSAPGTPLVLWDASSTNILNWWYANPAGTRKSLTGDNMRERPYDTLYPRLTTKSNSFTVHFRVQVLKKIPGTSVTQWVGGKDVVASELRGSSLIERYIDPSDPNLPDFATSPTATLDSYYKFRVVSTKKFTVE